MIECVYDFLSCHWQVSKNQLLLSNDRGTPLICSNCLEGVLSEILPASNRTSNSTCPDSLKTTAYYTKVSSHVNWVHSVIGVNLPAGVNGQTEPVKPITPPYQGMIFNLFNINEICVKIGIT